jgi:Leucine-rich repeat (LRR) protein
VCVCACACACYPCCFVPARASLFGFILYPRISKLTTLDLSKNKLRKLDLNLSNLKVLKSLNIDHNKLGPGSMHVLSSLPKLKTISANHNQLGRAPPSAVTDQQQQQQQQHPITKKTTQSLPETLPKGLRTISLSHNSLSRIPKSILENSFPLKMLEILDLSSNHLARVPDTIANLTKLTNLNLDDNVLTSLSEAIGKLKHLKRLSLRRNQIKRNVGVGGDVNGDLHPQQSLPKELWTNTLLIDLNLHGNPMTTTQLNTMDGYDIFLSRRREVKNKDILGGAMTDLEGCGLE